MEKTRRGETTDHRENEPPQVSVNGKVNHLLNWVKVWIVQIPQKPQNTRSEDLEHTKTIVNLFYSHDPQGAKRQQLYLSQKQNE